jgi:hypothetical protein
MRSLKTNGGLTRGSGMTEEQRAVWLLSTPACAEVNDAMQEVTGVSHRCSEQHKETTNTRTIRDYQDALKVMEYLLPRNPFTATNELINIHTGEVANVEVNVDKAKLVGNNIVKSMEDTKVSSYTFRKKDKAITMKNSSTIQIDDDVIHVDPQLLFQRLIKSVQGIGSDVDIETAFSYELCTYPSSLIEKDKQSNLSWQTAYGK